MTRRLLPFSVAFLAATPAWASGETTLGIPDPIWKTVNLIVFLWVLGRYVGRPIVAFLQSRREGIQKELQDSRRKLAEAEELRTQVVARLEDVEREVSELRDRAERDGVAEAERIREETTNDEERFLRRVEDEIERRTAESRQRLAEDTAALTAELARSLLEREITTDDRARLLQRSLAAMGQLKARG